MKLPIPDKALAQHVIALGKTGSGKSSKLRVLVEGLLEAGDPVCIIDPKGDWWGIKSSADGKRPGFPVVIFGGEHGDVPLNPHAGAAVAELIATGNRPSLIDLGGWMVGERTRFWIDFASAFFRAARGKRHLVIDEVHNFAPQGKVLDVDAGKALHWTNRIASEGRGKGITLIAASQRPQKVHKDFVTSCETLIACRVIHKLDRDAIKDWIDGCADPAMGREVIQTLATMKRDEAWCWSPEVEYGPVRIHWPMFSTYDSFSPQKSTVGRLMGWAAIDLAEVSGKLAGLVDEAKANDPKLLRGRIAELERKVRMQETASQGIPAMAEIKAAELRGYEAGHAASQKERQREREAHHKDLKRSMHQMVETFMTESAMQITIHPDPRKIEPLTLKALGEMSRAAERKARADNLEHGRAVRSVRAHTGAPLRSNGGEKLSKAERLALTALAQYPEGRTKVQVAVLCGYKHSGGGFNNALSALRGRGYIDGQGDSLKATREGVAALGSYDPLPTGRELLEYWMRKLSKAERMALGALATAYPKGMSKPDLAAHAGYEADGGGFNNALSRLRTLELIGGRGELRASEDLF